MGIFKRSKRIWAITMALSLCMVQNVSAVELYETEAVQSEDDCYTEMLPEEFPAEADDIYLEDDTAVRAEDTVSGNDAKEDMPAENETDEVSENSVSEDAVSEMMFPGLPDEYTISENDDSKEELRDFLADTEDIIEGIDCVEGQILVYAESLETAEDYADAFNGSLEDYENELAVIDLNENEEYQKATVMDAIMASSDEYSSLPTAWPNFYRYLYEDESGYPAEEAVISLNDPLLDPTRTFYQWHHSMLNSKSAWQAGYTGNGIKVAVIDTGINQNHEDIKANLSGAFGCAKNSNAKEDQNGHGSNVAGAIAAVGNNGKGGLGVAYNAKLYTFNVNYLDSSTGEYYLDDSGIINAIYDAVDKHKVDVINMSLGGPSYNGLLNNAVKHAYDKGVAVMCAAGNDNTNAIAYPAGCDGAISIAAADKDNKKAFFSNYGGIDFSGPGVNICSVFKGSADSYCTMSGTSQATPCVTGVAAVLLSTGKVTGTGSARVENLKKLMASGCVSSGLGKGTPDLARILKLTNTESAPAKPTIKNLQPGTYAAASVDVYFNDIPGSSIYYTVDGTNVSYKDGRISDGAVKYSGSKIVLTGAAKVVLKAIAVNETNKLAGPAASYTYTLKPKVSSIAVKPSNGVSSVLKGGQLQMEAEIKPDYAANKKVEWTIAGNVPGITITNNGLLKAARDTKATSCTVQAKAVDGSTAVGRVSITIKSSVSIKSVKASVKSCTLFSGQRSAGIDVIVKDVNNKDLTAAGNVTVSTEDPAIAGAMISGSKLTVSAKAAGKTRVYLTASDGSTKTCIINVTVKQSVTGISVGGPAGGKLAVGKGFSPTVDFAPKDAALKKLEWKITAFPGGVTASTCGVKVNPSSGAVSISKTAKKGLYTVKATAKDGSGVSGSFSFTVIGESIRKIQSPTGSVRIFRVRNSFGSPTTEDIQFSASGITANNNNSISVTSSNPGVVRISNVTVNSSSGKGSFKVEATGNSTGNATVTIASADGTNIKKTVKISVVNPPSAIRIAPPANRSQSLAKGKTMKLNVIIETGYGKVDSLSKKFTFKSGNPGWISVNPANGTAKAESSVSEYDSAEKKYKEAVITATAADGSKVSATYGITPCCKIRRITAGYVNTYGSVLRGNRVLIKEGADGTLIGMVSKESGTLSGRYQVTVNKPGLGVRQGMSGGYYVIYISGNKKGKYNVKLKPTDGNGGGCSWSVQVR